MFRSGLWDAEMGNYYQRVRILAAAALQQEVMPKVGARPAHRVGTRITEGAAQLMALADKLDQAAKQVRGDPRWVVQQVEARRLAL
jgi:hypothetical protein